MANISLGTLTHSYGSIPLTLATGAVTITSHGDVTESLSITGNWTSTSGFTFTSLRGGGLFAWSTSADGTEHTESIVGTDPRANNVATVRIKFHPEDLFNSSNSTSKVAYVYGRYKQFAYRLSGTYNGKANTVTVTKSNSTTTKDQVIAVVYSIKPKSTKPTVAYDTQTIVAKLTTASLTFGRIYASDPGSNFGNYITKVSISVGNSTTERTYTESSQPQTDETLSVLIQDAGEQEIKYTITESRGNTTSVVVGTVTVEPYTVPSVSLSAQRCDSNGVPDEETGTSGLITAQCSYTQAHAHLQQPTVTVSDGTTTESATVTWYTTWDETNGVSNEVNWTDYQPASPVTLYGLMTGHGSTTGFDEIKTYRINLTPSDEFYSGNIATGVLDGAFYTMDFLAGGHGIAFGQMATEEGFHCDLETSFKQNIEVLGETHLADTWIDGFVYPKGIKSKPNGFYREVYVDIPRDVVTTYDTSLTTSSDDSAWIKAYIKAICDLYPNHTSTVFKGYYNPNSAGWLEVFIYNTSDLTNGLPRYATGRIRKWMRQSMDFYINEYTFYGTSSPSSATCTIASGWTNYASGQNPVVYREGHICYFWWSARLTSSLLLDSTHRLCCTIPEGYRPVRSYTTLCQGSDNTLFYMYIETNGAVYISRLRSSAAGAWITATTSYWFPLAATYITT